MDTDVSLTATASILFLVLASKYGIAAVKKLGTFSEDVSLVIRTAVFALLLVGALRFM